MTIYKVLQGSLWSSKTSFKATLYRP